MDAKTVAGLGIGLELSVFRIPAFVCSSPEQSLSFVLESVVLDLGTYPGSDRLSRFADKSFMHRCSLVEIYSKERGPA